MLNGKNSENAKGNESANEVKTSSINFNNVEALETISKQLAYERFCELCKKGYYIYAEAKSIGKGKPYFWIVASKENDREEFLLNVTHEILHTVVSYLSLGTLNGILRINQIDMEIFNIKFDNFPFELFQAERAQSKAMRKSYTATTGTIISSYYRYGVIFYRPSIYDFKKRMRAA